MYKVVLWLKPPGANREDVLIEGQSLEQHNLDEVTLERQFVRPYREGRDIFLKGRKLPAFKVQRMQVLYLPYDPDSQDFGIPLTLRC